MSDPAAPLDGIRVLDLATSRAELAGRVLAELGAEVLKIEPPGGCDARRRGPWRTGREGDPEGSLYWAAVGLGKRSVVLDPFAPADAERLRALADGADVWIESFDPGALAPAGLDAATLCARNPALVYVSVTPFGQDGPLAHAPASDLTVEAAGGLVGLQGDPDRPPIPVGYPQASFHGGAQAAADAVIALCERLASGRGQHLDVSQQCAVVWTLMNATGYPPMTGGNPPGFCEQRAEGRAPLIPGLRVPLRARCADGTFHMGTALPQVGERTLHELLHWAEDRDELPADLRGRDWTHWIGDLVGGRRTTGEMNAAYDALLRFLSRRSKRELMDFAVERGVLVAPTYDVRDLRDDPQLAARAFWTRVGELTHPGPFARLSRTPLRARDPAPRLGADQARAADAGRPPPPRAPSRAPADGAFAGLKVADFAWVGVGPLISKALADHGALVIHVESESRPDILRKLPPFLDNQPGLERSHFFANFNTSKKGLAIDLSVAKGRELARRLAGWADVVVESFTPGTMERLGLDYAALSADRPDLVMLSTCMRGQTGPERTYSGFGNQGAALAGLVAITGWPDRDPAGPWGAYTDFIAPRYGVAALAAALFHRERTGLGQHIDLAQSEAGMRFIEPLVLDYTANGRVAGPPGHDSPYACPHGTYACLDPTRYVAIAVESDAQWRAFRARTKIETAGEAATLDERLARRAELESALRAWCAERTEAEIVKSLRPAGVPVHPVQWPTDLYRDPQLAHRGHFVTLDHAGMGPQPFDGPVTRFSRTPARLRKAAPAIGADTFELLQEVLGLTPDEISEYALAGALS